MASIKFVIPIIQELNKAKFFAITIDRRGELTNPRNLFVVESLIQRTTSENNF